MASQTGTSEEVTGALTAEGQAIATATNATGPIFILWRAFVRPLLVASWRAFVMWLGETAIGLIPLITYAVRYYYTDLSKLKHAPAHAEGDLTFIASALEEINILTVVLSGLSLVMLFKFDGRGLKCNFTGFTYISALLALLFIVVASLFFVIDTLDIGKDNVGVTLGFLYSAIGVSLFMTLEPAWLAVLKGFLRKSADHMAAREERIR